MVLCIPAEMASLTKRSAALRVGVGLVVVHVRDGQYDLAARLRVSLAVGGAAFRVHRRPFASVAGAFDQGGAKRLPLLGVCPAARIALHAVGVDRHDQPPISSTLQSRKSRAIDDRRSCSSRTLFSTRSAESRIVLNFPQTASG